MIKIVTIVGARPQFIKAAVVSRVIASTPDVQEVIVHTGQHYDANMSDIFFEEMQIPRPNYNLKVNGLSHGAMTGQMLEKIEGVLLQEKPDWVLVYGDTNSTLAGALAAKKLHIRIAHVEAGLRSFNMKMPEEINRILTDRISDMLFCPTDTAVNNLANEGFFVDMEKGADNKGGFGTVVRTGDVMKDAALFYTALAKKPDTLQDFKLSSFVLVTVHRAENTDCPERFQSIFTALNTIAKDALVVLPLHPRTRGKLQTFGLNVDTSNLILIDPVSYLEMIYLLKNCMLVMTDSGGLQKEAYFFNRPCLTLRDETEWVELVEEGENALVGADGEKIIEAWGNALKPKKLTSRRKDLYGDGHAGEKIIRALREA
ncbi:non-hydrolyzing UDP-N-acetylglucosamine 2-epimerase [Thiomicrolovo sp. ZZH C-3]